VHQKPCSLSSWCFPSPDGAMHRTGFHLINTAAASYVPRRPFVLARQLGHLLTAQPWRAASVRRARLGQAGLTRAQPPAPGPPDPGQLGAAGRALVSPLLSRPPPPGGA